MKPTDAKNTFWLSVSACLILIVLVFFKFLPDLGTSMVQSGQSTLVSWSRYEYFFLTPHSVHHARFLGNDSLYGLAKLIGTYLHSTDLRMHPLRVSATILTMWWFLVALAPLWFLTGRLDWKVYLPALAVMFIAGLYVFYPCDAPSLAFLALALTFLLKEQMWGALACMVITGLFRESAFHMVGMVGIWAVVSVHHSTLRRVLWLLVFAAVFLVEYKLIRHWYPGETRGMEWYENTLANPSMLLFGGGLWSLTTLMTLPLAVLYPLAWWLLKRNGPRDWVRHFFLLNCLAFPAWVLFYRIQGGNINEFRIMWPAILPCLFGLAWVEAPTAQTHKNGHTSH